jgi:Rrf2 family transcriptional regulator, iron-sulfur cluster assembly transcription factor
MPLSKKSLTALEAVLYIACHAGDKPVRSREICEYQGVALRYLEQVLQALVHGGIVKGLRGPKGGYVLARERRKITVADICDAVQALEAEEGAASVSPLHAQVLSPLCDEAAALVRQKMASVTLQQLCDRAGRAGASTAANRPDFTI